MSVTKVDKPWGHELHWAITERYVGKVLHVKAGHALSLQYHNVKDETIFLWTGKLLFEIQQGEELVKREMLPGESVHITPHTIHRMTAVEDSDIFEVSTPELDDVVRLEDRYGRINKPESPLVDWQIEDWKNVVGLKNDDSKIKRSANLANLHSSIQQHSSNLPIRQSSMLEGYIA